MAMERGTSEHEGEDTFSKNLANLSRLEVSLPFSMNVEKV